MVFVQLLWQAVFMCLYVHCAVEKPSFTCRKTELVKVVVSYCSWHFTFPPFFMILLRFQYLRHSLKAVLGGSWIIQTVWLSRGGGEHSVENRIDQGSLMFPA